MVFHMIKELFFRREGLAAVEVAGEYSLEIWQSLDAGVETAAVSAGKWRFLVAFIAEIVLTGMAHHSDMDGVCAHRAYFGLFLQALRVQLHAGLLTRTVAFSPKTS